MAPSFWNDVSDWVHHPYEETKEWAHSVYDNLVGGDSEATATSVVTATPTQFETTTFEYVPSATTSYTPELSTVTQTLAAQPQHASPTLVHETLVETATATVTAYPTPSTDSSAGFKIFFFCVGIVAFAVACALAIYVIAPVTVRFCMFAYNFLKLCLSKKSNGSFAEDSELGFTSESFSLTRNIESGDDRSGLDRGAKLRIMWYMFLYKESFDEARLRFVRRKFAQNGIGPDGQPLDPKFVGQFSEPASPGA